MSIKSSSGLLSAFSDHLSASQGTWKSSAAEDITTQVGSIIRENGLDIESIRQDYFHNIHVWFPILAGDRIQRGLENFTAQPCSELAGLLLSMALVTRYPGKPGDNTPVQAPMYFEAKALYSALVSSGYSQLEVMQMGILISLYEQGQGMTENAKLTMSTCARLAIKLNIQQRKLQIANIQDSEFGRSWWGLVILDRFMNLGVPPEEVHLVADSLILRNLHLELPNDDEEYQGAGIQFPCTPSGMAIRQPTTLLGPFCRTAQAADLLGRVLELVVRSTIAGRFDHAVWMPLDKKLHELALSLLQQAINGWEECCASIAVCLSALLTLHLARKQIPSADETDHETAMLAMKSAIRMVVEISRKFLMDIEYIELPSLPLPATFTTYQAALLHIHLARGNEIHSPEWIDDFTLLKGALGGFTRRWDVGTPYLESLDRAFMQATQQVV
ncbi:hypothetical protein BP6252_05811 [Coleophoma cylindrospora]|uniref:Xylanolytic transcriptional activator regulatory domain-containing protein n=1 Tax=Coleophoma cylindrospora TaxID=1849047 RepID=A0A3D8RUV2_9HELO|nr:hypothetical protein BP6252_05811 [Coleophoma cylindrospora]